MNRKIQAKIVGNNFSKYCYMKITRNTAKIYMYMMHASKLHFKIACKFTGSIVT